MDIGICFDDEDFEKKKTSERKKLVSYNAKVCHKLWFQERDILEYDEALVHRLKFDGDYKYYQNQYRDAIVVYKEALGLQYSNPSILHDIKESLCRCYSKLLQHDEASQLAEELFSTSQNDDQKLQSLILLTYIYKEANNLEGEVQTLKYLIQLNPFCEQLWLTLAEKCQKQLLPMSKTHMKNMYSPKLLILTCLVRARLLVVYSMKQTDSFCKDKNIEFQKKVEQMISNLEVDEECIDFLTRVLKKELSVCNESSRESVCANNTKVSNVFSEEEFDTHWFSWIHDYECRMKS